jgi:Uma2 family endonuclease
MQPVLPMRNVWTFEDLQALDVEDWRRYEIVDGALLVSPTPAIDHEFVIAEIPRVLVRAAPDGLVVLSGALGIRIGSSYRVPDLAVVHRAVRGRNRQYLWPEDVALAVEVVSPGSVSMDRILKPAQYAAAGIPAYWRVETDPISLTAYELRPGEAAYTEAGTWNSGEIVRLDKPFPVEVEIDRLGA